MQKEAMLYEKLEDKKVHCKLCSHHCNIPESKFGFCGVRKNIDGTLYSLIYGEIIAAHIDPIEKKPLYHFLPGTKTYSIATPGCNLKCNFCQNWQISQYRLNQGFDYDGIEMPPEKIVDAAKLNNCSSISYTYTEPTIFFEYAYDNAKLAKKENIKNIFVTNGFMTKQTIETIAPYLDAANVDLKSFREAFYKNICGARLKPILESIKNMYEDDIWIEITTLVVTGQNDSEEEFSDIAKFIADLSIDIPWHISRFHPDYQFTDAVPTPIKTLKMAEQIGKNYNLKNIHIGNV